MMYSIYDNSIFLFLRDAEKIILFCVAVILSGMVAVMQF